MSDVSEEFLDTIEILSGSFDQLCQERHDAGAKEYGAITFIGNDVVRMMMEELADTANYCRMQYIKLMLLQIALEEDPRINSLKSDGDEITIGVQAFKGVGDMGWKK